MFGTPLLFIIFNRPSTTYQVFESIRSQKPSQIFIASDGPRSHVPGEEEVVMSLRMDILNRIDWDCEVKTLFQDSNLGCGKGPSTAISWFFSHVEKGIILEDDVLPDPSFYSFMEQMLDKYADDKSVLHITGQNLLLGKKANKASYYFSSYPLIWGWASWRRAWQFYDFTLDTISEDDIQDMPSNFISIFHQMKANKIDTWDYQWNFSVWKNKGKCIVPKVNLIRNLGFGEGATHTHLVPEWYGDLKNGSIGTIIHPSSSEISIKADLFFVDKIVNGNFGNISLRIFKNFFSQLRRVVYEFQS